MNDRVLVTGATGFIGHHLVHALLEKGDRVTCLARPSSDTSRLPIERVSLAIGDLTDPPSLQSALADVGVIYHLAGIQTARSLEQFQSVNEAGVRNLVEACARLGSPPTLIALSSLAAAGPNSDDRPRREQDPDAPVSKYGNSKLAGERVARAFGDKFPLTIVRAPIVFGEWDRDVWKIFRLVKLGVHAIPVSPRQHYSLIHAADLARLLILAAARGERAVAGSAGSGLYYGGYDQHLTYAELGAQVAAALSHRQVVSRRRVVNLRIPQPLTLTVAAAFEVVARLAGRPPDIINLDKAREGFAGSWSCSPAKAQQQLGFQPAQPLPARLRQTADWYRARGWL